MRYLLILLLLFVGCAPQYNKDVTYLEYLQYLQSDSIESAVITGRTFKGTLKEDHREDTFNTITIILPEVTTETIQEWDALGIEYVFKNETLGIFDYIINIAAYFITWLIAIMMIPVYFIPSIIVMKNKYHKNKTGVHLLNFFLGWTLIGWIVALAWSFSSFYRTSND